MPNINFKFDQVLFRYKMKGIFLKCFQLQLLDIHTINSYSMMTK